MSTLGSPARAQPYLRAMALAVQGRLENLDLALPGGSTLAILGPSGSGKTTLLRLLAGFMAPDSGRLELRGELVSCDGKVLVPTEQRQLAFAFQEPALMPHLDAIGNVGLGLRGTREGRLAIAQRALADVGLAAFGRRRIWELSGGEAQRIQLARALASSAPMLLLDEPFASVDRMCRADLISRIGTRLKSGARPGIVAIVTHDPADACELADQTLLLKAGKVVAYGRLDDIAAGVWGDWPAQFVASGLAGQELS